jgi:DNA recombination-dependent growth factor C
MKREQKVITPSQVLAETVGEKENNVDLKQETNETRKEEKKVERKRVSFDLRTDLHKELKMQALLQDKNIYILIEEALEKYLSEKK